MPAWMRKIAATVAFLALLVPSVAPLAESLSASELPSCCNTSYCPLHHRDAGDLQRDRKNCDTAGTPDRKACSMRACDSVGHPAVGPALYILVSPISVRELPWSEGAFFSKFLAFPYVADFPLTPPPRTFLS
jgi:hypothetical protein